MPAIEIVRAIVLVTVPLVAVLVPMAAPVAIAAVGVGLRQEPLRSPGWRR